ncbi:MAG TPA: hypothetical protein DCP92_02595 [Nitrospiraceae bacterium]|jgi:hypothetical protein|nr:hypothetical protein [Nitrospiraceae bacterium]
MAISRDMGFGGYCDSVTHELSGMKSKLLGFIRDIELMEGPEKQTLQPHIQHFRDIIKIIDWKLEILRKVCPFDWAGYAGEVERTASVRMQEPPDKDFVAGGYIGG